MKIAVILTCLASIILAKSSGDGLEIYNGYNINLKLIDVETVQLDVVIPNEKTFLLFFVEEGSDDATDFIKFESNGRNSEYFDMHISMTGPEIDEVEDLRGRFANMGSEVMYRLSRLLDTGDVE